MLEPNCEVYASFNIKRSEPRQLIIKAMFRKEKKNAPMTPLACLEVCLSRNQPPPPMSPRRRIEAAAAPL